MPAKTAEQLGIASSVSTIRARTGAGNRRGGGEGRREGEQPGRQDARHRRRRVPSVEQPDIRLARTRATTTPDRSTPPWGKASCGKSERARCQRGRGWPVIIRSCRDARWGCSGMRKRRSSSRARPPPMTRASPVLLDCSCRQSIAACLPPTGRRGSQGGTRVARSDVYPDPVRRRQRRR